MLKTFPATGAPEEILQALRDDGGVIVEELLQEGQVEDLRADLGPHIEKAHWGDATSDKPDEFFGKRTKRLHGLFAKSPLMADLVQHPLVLELATKSLDVGERCHEFRISTCESMTIGPGEVRQRLHRDFDAWYFAPFKPPRPEHLFSANIALDDFTKANGATVVAPGSHMWDAARRAETSELTQAVMKKGSALLYSGEVVHGGGPNETTAPRTGLYIGYIASWLRPTENHLLTNGEETLSALPQDVQRFLNVIPSGFSLIS